MLKTWITGTKDYADQGLAPSEWINDNVTIVDSGKLGKCMYFNGSTSRLSTTNYSLSRTWSFACLVKEDSSVTNWQMVLGLNNNGSDADLQMGLWLKSNENRLEMSYNGSYNSVIPYTPGQWNHFVGTFDGNEAKFYINGSLIRSITNTGNLPRTNLTIGARCTNTAGGHSSIANPLKGLVNDVKIWDNHALSAKEVSELAKGLVLHYRLSGVGGENIMPNSRAMALGSANASTGIWRLAGSNTMTKSRVAIDDSPIGECYGFQNEGIQTPDDGYCYGIDNFPFEANTDYTISMWARIVNGSEGYAGFNIYSIASEDFPHDWTLMKNYRCTTLPSDGSWKRCVYTFTTNSSTNRNIYIGIVTGDTNVTTQMCGVKIEKGLKTTPWIPNLSDTEYSIMGLDDGIEYDTSGFQNNGTQTGTITWNSDSARYNSCYEMTGTSYINCGKPYRFIPDGSEEFTVNIWAYKDAWDTSTQIYSCTESGGFSLSTGNNSISCYCHVYGASSVLTNSSGENITNSSGDTILLSTSSSYISFTQSHTLSDGWHMFTMVYTKEGLKLYVDGNIVRSVTSSSIGLHYNKNCNLFIGAEATGAGGCSSPYLNGKASDLRIFATALSASDILALYNLGGSLDSNGTFHTYEYVEV